MNELKTDKLFHDKLAELEVQPSMQAWSEIENRITKKRNKSKFWIYGIAASLVVAITSTFVWMNVRNGDGETEKTISENIEDEVILPSADKDLITLQPVQDKSDELLKGKEEEGVKPVFISSIMEVEKNGSTDSFEKSNILTESYSPDFISLKKQGPEINLLFAQLNILKPDLNFIPVNNSDLSLPEDESGIKKVYDYAMRVKNGEESLFDLRKAKDDLFAMARNIKINQSDQTK